MTLTAITFSSDDYRYMAKAIKLAKRGHFTTHPNPRVGCVLVKDNKIIGEGYHRKAGDPHAERMALAQVKNPNDTQGSTAYVTLEPCCHHGKTPPCTDALIKAGIGQVIIAMQDPNPLVAGNGIKLLESKNIKVKSGLLESQARGLNKGFIKLMQQKLPFVRCKLACSLDGRSAMASGESVWISSEQSRHDVQFLRAESAAVMTGVGTILTDDPSMNVRLSVDELSIESDLEVRQPLRVIVDTDLKTPSAAKILKLSGQVIIFCAPHAVSKVSQYDVSKVTVIPVDVVDGKLDLKQILFKLGEKQIGEILLETGAILAGNMLSKGLIDEIIVYQAPHLMGDSAKGLFYLPNIQQMSDRVSLELLDVRQIGNDIRFTAKVAN